MIKILISPETLSDHSSGCKDIMWETFKKYYSVRMRHSVEIAQIYLTGVEVGKEHCISFFETAVRRGYPIDEAVLRMLAKEAVDQFIIKFADFINSLPVSYRNRKRKNLLGFISDAIFSGMMQIIIEFIDFLKPMKKEGIVCEQEKQ